MENIVSCPNSRIKQVVFWGHQLHTHTHSYIYAGFKKAFEHLGYKTHWFTDNENVAGIDFSNSLFFATSSDGREKNIPLNKTSYYVLHNVDAHKYCDAGCKILFLQTRPQNHLDDKECTVFNQYTVLKIFPDVPCLYMIWAADLLPTEINEQDIKNTFDKKTFVWIGTYGGTEGEFQNGTELYPYIEECKKNGIEPIMISPWSKPVSFEENRKIVQEAYLAPAIQGPWQINNSYVPCRILKHISYGNIGITNNACVNSLFDGLLVYDRDPIGLFQKSIDARTNFDLEKHKFLMNEVRTKHTYLNRIEYILKCLPD